MADQLMFVKEDLIIPQHNTFYVSEQLCLFYLREKKEKNIWLIVFCFFFFSLYTFFNAVSSATPRWDRTQGCCDFGSDSQTL
jgi:hypothetical protein